MTEAPAGTLGILAFSRSAGQPAGEPRLCAELAGAGARYGLAVRVFAPEGAAAGPLTQDGPAGGGARLPGWELADGGWREGRFPPPDILLDRTFPKDAAERKLAARARSRLAPVSLPWSRGLPGKWAVHGWLLRDPEAAALLPETCRLTGPGDVLRLAGTADGAILKPETGAQGRGIVHVRPHPAGGWTMRGRDAANRPFLRRFPDRGEGLRWLLAFAGGRRYLVQRYLRLLSAGGQPFDVRVLMQKDASGRWQETGRAVRLGPRGRLTSNLHGGGSALPVLPFLRTQYGAEAGRIMERLTAAAERIPALLEAGFGRQGELGLDFGIGQDGRIWLLEANSKPGRAAFRRIGDRQAAQLASDRPAAYARRLLELSRAARPRRSGSARRVRRETPVRREAEAFRKSGRTARNHPQDARVPRLARAPAGAPRAVRAVPSL